jgi:hypothetical protein
MKGCGAATYARFIKMLLSPSFVPYICGGLEKVCLFEGTESEKE